MDPLTVFKDFVQNGQLDQVHVDEGKVRFADKYSFPASAATAFRREGLTSAHYPLAVVVNFFKWHASGTNLVQYIRQYPNKNDQVALPDRAVSSGVVLLEGRLCGMVCGEVCDWGGV